MIAGVLRENEVQTVRWGEEWPGGYADRSKFYPEMCDPGFRDAVIVLCCTLHIHAYFAEPCELDGWVFVARGRKYNARPSDGAQTVTLGGRVGQPTPWPPEASDTLAGIQSIYPL